MASAEDYVSYSQSIHTDVLLPTVSHEEFLNNASQQEHLLQLLYNKVAIEHRTSNHELFLQFDEERTGLLTAGQFREALSKMGLPLNTEQVNWLVNKFDCNHDNRINYSEFINMIHAWQRSHASCTSASAAEAGNKTGLTWKSGPLGSPHKEADDAREERKKVVLEQYAKTLKQAHHGMMTTTHAATAEEGLVPSTLRKLAQVAYEKLGGLKRAFLHMDSDGDREISKDDLHHTLEHHLGLELSEEELDNLFKALDFDDRGTIHYYEFIRVLSSYAEDVLQEGTYREDVPWSPKGAKAPAAASTKAAAAPSPVMAEGDETVGFTEDEELKEDDEVLRKVSDILHERGLHAHGLIKRLLPESNGKLDVEGLQCLFERLGLPITKARAQRFMSRGDMMQNGQLVSWELVRLISSAAAVPARRVGGGAAGGTPATSSLSMQE